MDSSSLGTCRRLHHNATNTTQQRRRAAAIRPVTKLLCLLVEYISQQFCLELLNNDEC